MNGREWDAMGYREVLGEPYAPYGCYPCRGEDNWIIIACASDEEWQSMVSLIGKSSWAADPKFATKSGRKQHHADLDRKLAQWVRNTPRQAFRRFKKRVAAGIPSSGEDLYYDVHLRGRGHIVETKGPPGRRCITACRVFHLCRQPAPPARHPGLARTMIKYLARSWD